MLADKEALAARKLVYSTCVAQLVALGAAAYAMSHFSRTELPNICKFRIVWWGGYVDSSSDLNFDKVSMVLWYFFAARTFSILRTLADSLAFTGIFHDAKHQPPTPPPSPTQPEGRDKNLVPEKYYGVIPKPFVWTAAKAMKLNYKECIATTSLAPWEHIFHIGASFLSTAALLKQCSPANGALMQWGQLAPVVVAGGGMFHWLFITMDVPRCRPIRSSFRGFNRGQHFDEHQIKYRTLIEGIVRAVVDDAQPEADREQARESVDATSAGPSTALGDIRSRPVRASDAPKADS
ncbi:hypothetical protein PV05_10941 [Exophiala xenobiotica]|uniref:Uncharacterized protein n=1 Tax=Exophiala xenobiotica TaxID=348802 RepID=A0A0D2BAJ2_9EURO|nr:uncharacterized protein PV05_10941 [Exophiala xenobiotica]KIW49246.1 hypothetical protein PV05_10941 [Exophiala xenobiotica]